MKAKKAIFFIVIFIFLNISCFAAEYLKIGVLELEDGEAIVIQTPNLNALVDTGSLLSGYKLIEYLNENNIRELDYLIITHPDPDHIGGVFFAAPKFKINKFFDNGQELIDRDIERWYGKLVREERNYRALESGDAIKIGKIRLEVLWPIKPSPSDNYNTNSLVMMLQYNNFRCLLAGDLNTIGEKEMLKKKLSLNADILKVGHHGYQDATSEEFLQAVSPKYAIISVDSQSRKDMPSIQTIELLKEKGVKIYRTDINGNIIITVEKNGQYNIVTQR